MRGRRLPEAAHAAISLEPLQHAWWRSAILVSYMAGVRAAWDRGSLQGGGTGLRLVFDQALDGSAWPGSLGERAALFGESWCGPARLLERLETELGLVTAAVGRTVRAAAFAQTLVGQPGYWSQSFDADPLATAQRMLADRDLLALGGWTGQSAGTRLDALWAVTAAALPGIPDRLRRVLELVPRRALDLASIAIYEPLDALPPLWRAVLDALQTAGVLLEQRELPSVTATGDLAAARLSSLRPAGDGSLSLVRPQGPLEAAEEIAAALAACDRLDGIVIVGGDAVLDAALGRHGLPSIGAARGATGSSALVRLVVETAFAPMDADHLHALICVDPGPVHGKLKRGLVRALGKFPARGSAPWLEALADGLAKVDDEQRDGVAARFTALVDAVVGRAAPLSLELLEARMRALSTWAKRRAHGRDAVPSVLATGVLADRLLALARATGAVEHARTTLLRLLDELEAPLIASAPAEVGLATVSSPGAILGPARAVVWWSFTRASAPSPSRLRLTEPEQAALVAAGVTPPDPGGVMAGEARRWRRPLELAQESLVLVCPRTDDAGERAQPHPLWDELTARLSDSRDAAKLERSRVTLPAVARREPATLRALIVPAAEVRGPVLELADPESPSSLEALLGCSLAWALHKKGFLSTHLGTGPGQPGPLHYGNIAHLILEHVFAEPVVSPDAAAARAEALFDAGLGTLAEALLLPELQTSRAELRRGIVESARQVGQLVRKTGAKVRGPELPVSGMLGTARVGGRTDLMLDDPEVIIDYKWGFSTYRELLKTGTAFQLVAYAALAKTGAELPQIAYLTLGRQELLAPAGTTLPDARAFSAHTAADMLVGALAAIAERRAQLAEGRLVAPSAVEDAQAVVLAGGMMRLVPKCSYCDLGVICGKRARA